MDKGRVKVAYIAGTGKSGSTLLGKLLGQVEGFADVGELINLHAQFDRGARCGCGAPVAACDLWPRVVAEGLGGGLERLDRGRWRRLRSRYLPLLLLPGARTLLPRYFHQLPALHRALKALTGARVIADGSKSLFYGAVLALAPGCELYTVHLVRDVRAAEGSMYRLRSEGAEKFASRTTGWNSLRWVVLNRITEWVARRVGSPYLRVRYEDLVSDPAATLGRILEFLGEGSAGRDFLVGNEAQLKRTHNVAGSDVRFKEGPITLKLDERWRDSLPAGNRALVDRLTRRFRRRYGY